MAVYGFGAVIVNNMVLVNAVGVVSEVVGVGR